MKIRVLTFIITTLIMAPSAMAQVRVDQSVLRGTSVTVTLNGVDSTREIFCRGKTPGQAGRRSGSQVQFTPFVTLIRSPATKPARLPLLKQLASKGKIACSALPPATPPTPGAAPTSGATPPATATQTPAPARTATPAPTATPASGNFDSLGNVTAQGRVLFAIPSGSSANVSRGKTVFQSFCAGCHSERTNRTYTYLDQSIRRSPMLYDDLQLSRPQQLADLTAYLNRFRP
jgi:hypothetical protein